jgi:hypothetical protein
MCVLRLAAEGAYVGDLHHRVELGVAVGAGDAFLREGVLLEGGLAGRTPERGHRNFSSIEDLPSVPVSCRRWAAGAIHESQLLWLRRLQRRGHRFEQLYALLANPARAQKAINAGNGGEM